LKSATITWPTRFGQTYVIEASDDLVSWDELEDNPMIIGNTGSFTESDIKGPDGRRFYRVRVL
jgi:hypothetical protein